MQAERDSGVLMKRSKRTPRRSALAVAALVLVSLLSAAALASTSSAGTYYCDNGTGVITPPNTECGQVLTVSGNTYNHNQSYAKGSGNNPSIQMCEGVKIGSNSGWASYRCSGTPVDSNCDVTGQYASTLHMYAGNGNNSTYVSTVGEGYLGGTCA